MSGRVWIPRFLIITLILILFRVNSQCEFSFTKRNKVFNFNLASSIPKFPHGALSEDGYFLRFPFFSFLIGVHSMLLHLCFDYTKFIKLLDNQVL